MSSSARRWTTRGGLTALFGLCLALASGSSTVAQMEALSVPSGEELESLGATIGEIEIRLSDIFDPEAPGENNRMTRIANRLHWKTRQGVIRRALLFQSGEPYSEQAVRESERLLRESGYLYDAKIAAVRLDDGQVDMLVYTRDVWTLRLGFGFGRKGGTNTSQFGLGDKNFLGRGKYLQFKQSSGIDRTSSQFRFRDPSVLGGRWQLDVVAANSNDGETREFRIGRPFYSLSTRWATSASAYRESRVDSLYDLGEIYDSFTHLEDRYEISGGLSSGNHNRITRRYNIGLTFQEDRFESLAGSVGAIPADRTLIYPWFQFNSIQDGFVRTKNVDKIERTEDLNLGAEWSARIGYAAAGFGADRNATILNGTYRLGMAPGEGQLFLFSLYGGGRFGSSGEENLLAGGRARYHSRFNQRTALVVDLEADIASNLDGERQLLIGGDSGLRGYPLRYQRGDRRVLLRVEQRFFTDIHLFKLARVGAAVFVDAGNAWFHGALRQGEERKGLYRDIGVGLRLGNSRSAHASMVHLDIAVPLDGGADISRLQFLISTKEKF